jgi:hypothetical protein
MNVSAVFKGVTSFIPGSEMVKNLIVLGLLAFLLYAISNAVGNIFSWDHWFGPTKEEVQAQNEEFKKAIKANETKNIVAQSDAVVKEVVQEASDKVVNEVRKSDVKTIAKAKKVVKDVEAKIKDIRNDKTTTEEQKHIQESQIIYDSLVSAAAQVTTGDGAAVKDADILASLV